MRTTVRAFSGMRPVMAQDLLKPGEAVLATNTLLTGGDMMPYNQPLQTLALTSASPVLSVYRYGQNNTNEAQYWFQSTADANFVKGPIDGDTEERTYFTGHLAYPAKTRSAIATTSAPYPFGSVPMGLKKPSVAPTATVSGTATDPASAAESVVYVMTLVTDWGEEGPPSDASALVSWRAGQTITLGLSVATVTSYPGNSDKSGQTYTFKRLYRSATGSSGSARFLYLGQVTLATTTFTDTTLTASLGEALPSKGFVEPPDDMLGLTQMANGMLAGYSGNTVCFCEPGFPYAWPVKYQQSTDAPIVGMASFNQTLLVATKRSLYAFTGVDPSSITSERLAVSQTCAAKRSMVEMMGGVVFASPDGLAFVDGSGIKMLTDGLMTRREWQAYNPSSMTGYESDNRYIVFFDNGTRQAGLIFSFGEDATFSETDYYATAGFRDRGRDALYLVFNGGGSTRNLMKWDGGASPSTMTWLSGVFRMPTTVNIAVARMEFTGTLTFELLADGVVKHGPVTPTSGVAFKLPAGYRSMRYQVRVTGTGTLRAFDLADSMRALSDG